MSILSKIGSVLKKLWEGLKKLIKKFWPIILLITVIVISIYFPAFWAIAWKYISAFFATAGAWIKAGLTTLGSWASGALNWAGSKVASMGWADALKLAAGVALVAKPDAVLDGIGSAIGKIAKAIPSWVWLAGGGLLLWWLWPDSSDGQTVRVEYGEPRA